MARLGGKKNLLLSQISHAQAGRLGLMTIESPRCTCLLTRVGVLMTSEATYLIGVSGWVLRVSEAHLCCTVGDGATTSSSTVLSSAAA